MKVTVKLHRLKLETTADSRPIDQWLLAGSANDVIVKMVEQRTHELRHFLNSGSVSPNSGKGGDQRERERERETGRQSQRQRKTKRSRRRKQSIPKLLSSQKWSKNQPGINQEHRTNWNFSQSMLLEPRQFAHTSYFASSSHIFTSSHCLFLSFVLFWFVRDM